MTTINLHPDLQKYLETAEERRLRMESPEYRENQGQEQLSRFEGANDQNQAAAYAKAFSQLGTLKGKPAGDTSAVSDMAQGVNAASSKMYKSMDDAQDDLDRRTGLRQKTLEYLQNKMEQQQKGEAEVARHDADMKQRKELADRSDQRAWGLAAMSDKRARDLAEMQLGSQKELMASKHSNEMELAKTKSAPVDKAAQKSEQETNYRYISLKNNANQLKDLVAKNGTSVLKGPEGTQMDSLIYQMAVDYAKMVDPDSVAREGEVASAQKYMLPFREWGGLTTSNNTAKAQIDSYVKSLDSRLAARNAAKAGDVNAVTYEKEPERDGTAYAGDAPSKPAGPQVGAAVDGYVFKGGDPSKPESWEKQ